MTSFIIKSHLDRSPAPSWSQNSDSDCSFCRIIRNELPAYRVFENDEVLAILDILPLRRGHTLVIPKAHYSRLSELPAEYAAATGVAVSKVSHALTQALGNTGLNVVCNQEYAQAVPHVHFHIIPAPTFGTSSEESTPITGFVSEFPAAASPSQFTAPLSLREMHQKEFESREELDENEAHALAKKIMARL